MRALIIIAGLITLLLLVVIQLTYYFNYLRRTPRRAVYAQRHAALLADIDAQRAYRQATNHRGEAHGISLYYNVSGSVEDTPLDRFPSFSPRGSVEGCLHGFHNEGAQAYARCDEHHFVSTHQRDLPISWIRQCSLCGYYDPVEMTEQIHKYSLAQYALALRATADAS